MTILVFGFEQFLEFDENPAGLVARHLEQKGKVGDHDVVSKILHVDYSLVEKEICSAIDEVNPVLTVGFGLAPSRAKFTPEKIAINYRYSHEPDNKGRNKNGEPIEKNAPDGMFTDLPVEGLIEHLNMEGIPSALSTTAGAYLCNNAMFVIVREAKKRGSSGGFIHIPCHSEWVARKSKLYPSLPLDTLFKAAELSIAFFLAHIERPVLEQAITTRV